MDRHLSAFIMKDLLLNSTSTRKTFREEKTVEKRTAKESPADEKTVELITVIWPEKSQGFLGVFFCSF